MELSTSNYLWDWILAQGKSEGVLTGIRSERFDVGIRVQVEFILQHSLWDKKRDMKWNHLYLYKDDSLQVI
jgi:hypothetical protein